MSGFSEIFRILLVLFGLLLSLVWGGCQIATSDEQSPVAALLTKMLGGDSAEKREKLINGLLSPDADIRRESVLKLGEGEAARWDITPKILENRALGDESGQVRAAAVLIYAKLVQSEELPEVLKKAAYDIDARVRMEAVLALGKRRDDESLEVLLQLLEEDAETSIRARSAAELVYFRDRRSVRGLTVALDDDEFSVSYHALRSLRGLTGQDFGYDRLAWQEWFYTTERVFGETGEERSLKR